MCTINQNKILLSLMQTDFIEIFYRVITEDFSPGDVEREELEAAAGERSGDVRSERTAAGRTRGRGVLTAGQTPAETTGGSAEREPVSGPVKRDRRPEEQVLCCVSEM